MNSNETLIRAREAVIASLSASRHARCSCAADYRSGRRDEDHSIRAILKFATDLSSPFKDVAPVDPDLITARSIAASMYASTGEQYHDGSSDDYPAVRIALASIKHGREQAKADA